ncbi:MAG: hypothetical protein M3Y34_06240, partial [Actinomycetota bacterium]|nr:hypothetical protein [Actinomycetota bacterium]
VEVALEDHGRAVAGEVRGADTTAGIVVRGEQLGTIQLSHRRRLEREDRAAVELLAVQTGLAADNHRLLVQEREAAAIEAELRHIRDTLLEQRDGLSLLLDAEEDERRRHAEKLHEELAQVLAGVLMQLRMTPREDGSLEELHDEVRGVLAALRDIATALRPSTLAHLGLLPALQAIDGLTVEADDAADQLPEPLRTGVYRLVEHVVRSAPPGARVRLDVDGDRLDVLIDAELTKAAVLGAARARLALLGGSLQTEARPAGGMRLRMNVPLTGLGARPTMRHPLSA